MTITQYNDYRAFLTDELAKRCHSNPRYSLRAFARDLGVNPPGLSEILNRKKGMSVSSAAKISERLNLNEDEASFFCDLVQKEDARSPSARKVAAIRLRRFSDEYDELKTDVYRYISDWYHFAIMELTQIPGFKNDADWIAKQLNIQPMEAKLAVERLLRLGILTDKNGALEKTSNDVTTTCDVPSQSIRDCQTQLLDLAKQALISVPLDQRDFSTITMAIEPSKLGEAKDRLQRFRRELASFLKGDQPSHVYCLSLQLFPLQQSRSDS